MEGDSNISQKNLSFTEPSESEAIDMREFLKVLPNVEDVEEDKIHIRELPPASCRAEIRIKPFE